MQEAVSISSSPLQLSYLEQGVGRGRHWVSLMQQWHMVLMPETSAAFLLYPILLLAKEHFTPQYDCKKKLVFFPSVF